jgi:hypothetical protein
VDLANRTRCSARRSPSPIGTYLISLAVLGLVLLGIQTYRNPGMAQRGHLGPGHVLAARVAPAAPPCYAERVVPELVYRSTWLATEQVAWRPATARVPCWSPPPCCAALPGPARTALLTYGSPTCRLYMRAFPNYFNEVVLNDIGTAVAGPRGQERWVNLWRRTDPIGGAVGIGDRRLPDPVAFDPVPGDRIPPAVKAHGGYQLTPEFAQAMADLVALLYQ